MNIQSLFGSVAIGKDTSGNFKQSVYGLAVRSGPQGRFIARHDGELVDVTDLTFDGTENLVYRLPKKSPIPKKDIIIRSDIPSSVLFVDEVGANGTVKGIDPATGDVQEYRPVTNLLNVHFFVAAVGPENLISGDEEDASKELLPLLLLGNQGSGTNTADPLTTLLLLGGLGSKEIDSKMLMMLLLLNGGATGSSKVGTGVNTADPLTTVLLLRSLGSKEIDSKMLMMLLLLRGGATGGSNDPFALLLALQGGDLFGEKKQSKSSQDKEHAPHTNDRRAEGSKQR